MTAILGLLVGPFGPAIRYAALALAIVGGGWLLLARHDAALMARRDAQETAAVAAERDRQHVMAVAALQEAARDAEMRINAVMAARKVIANAPVTTGCAASPAIAIALDGLRHPAAGSGSPGSPVVPADVPGATGAARAAPR